MQRGVWSTDEQEGREMRWSLGLNRSPKHWVRFRDSALYKVLH